MKHPTDPLASVRLTPCPRSWESLAPGPEGAAWRSCDACQLRVHDVAALPEKAAQRLIRERDSRLCLRILRRPDGSVVTRGATPPPVRFPRARFPWARVHWARRLASAASWLLLCLGIAPGCNPQSKTPGAEAPPPSPTDGETAREPPSRLEAESANDLEQLMMLGYVSEALGGFAE